METVGPGGSGQTQGCPPPPRSSSISLSSPHFQFMAVGKLLWDCLGG